MNKTRLTLFIIFFLNLLYSNTQGQTWAEILQTVEKHYDKGRYDLAVKKAEKVKKTIAEKYENKYIYQIWLYIQQAKVYEAKGQFDKVGEYLALASNNLESEKTSDLEAYIIAKIHTADVYFELGKFRQNIEMLETLEKELESLSENQDFWQLEIDTRLLKTYIQTGEFMRGQDLRNELKERWQVFNDIENISKPEKRYRKGKYLEAITTEAYYESQKGNFIVADSLLSNAKGDIKKMAKYAPREYVLYYETIADNLLLGDFKREKESQKALVKSQKMAGRKLRKSSKLYLKAQENLVNWFIYKKKRIKYQEGIKFFDKIIYSYYRKGESIYKIQRAFLDAKKRFVVNNKREVIADLEKILAYPENTLPKQHSIRIETQELLYKINLIGDYNTANAKTHLNNLIQTQETQMGTNAPNYLYQQIRLADFILKYSDKMEDSKEIYTQKKVATRIYEEFAKTHPKHINTLNYEANFFHEVDELEKALKNRKMAYRGMKEKRGERKESNIKIVEKTKHKIDKQTENSLEAGLQLIEIAKAKIALGKYKEAEADMNKARNTILLYARPLSLEYADLMSEMATLYNTMGRYVRAKVFLRVANKIYKKSKKTDVSQQASSIEELASLYIRIGEYAQTEGLLLDLLENKEAKYGAKSKKLIKTLNQLGILYTIKGDYKKAQENALKANEIAEKTYGNKSLRYAITLETLAEFYLAIGDYKQATDYIKQSIQIREAKLGKNHIMTSQALTILAKITLNENSDKITETEKILTQVKEINAETFGVEHPSYAESLKNLANLYMQTGKYDLAKQNLTTADEIWFNKFGRNNVNSAQVALLFGDIYRKENNVKDAKYEYKRAEKMFAKIFHKEHPNYVKTISKQGQLYFVAGNLKKANKKLDYSTKSYLKYIKEYFPALSEREKSRFWNLIRSDFEFYNTLAVNQAQKRPELLGKMYDFQLATKGLLLSSSIKIRQSILNSNDESLKALFNEWVEQKEYLTSILSMSPEALKENDISPKEVEKGIEKLEKQLSEKSDIFAQNLEQEAASWTKIKETLKPNEAVVEIIRFRNYRQDFEEDVFYAALLITKESKKSPSLVLLENGKDLEKKFLSYYRNANRHNLKDKYSYKNYWQAIAQKLEDKSIIYFSPDGVYNQLNPESFRIEGDTFVIDKQNVRFVSNSKDLLEKPNTTTSNEIVLFGNPTFYEELSKTEFLKDNNQRGAFITDLPGTKKEIDEVVKISKQSQMQTKSYTQHEAKEEVLKNLDHSPKILHIATHGFFMPQKEELEDILEQTSTAQNPMLQSGILAAGAGDILAKSLSNFNTKEGVFTAYEAINMDLANTDLVILSACETGLGEVKVGEGVFGLQRSFLIAGAKSVIMSLFKVDDAVTQELMQTFYENYLVKKQDKRTAFNNAQKFIKSKYKKPIYWGAFNMIGVE